MSKHAVLIRRPLQFLLITSLWFFTISPAPASTMEEDLALRKQLEARIAEITRNDKLHKQMLREGRDRTVLCNTCHGENGMAVKPRFVSRT